MPARALGLLAALLLFAAALLVAHDLITEAPPTYEPVVAETALNRRPIAGAGRSLDAAECTGLPQRWIVIGWDGAGWDRILPMLDEGRLPHLATLMREGSHGNLYGFRPSLSPALWTTVATGVSPDVHGVRGFDKRKHRLLRRWERIRRLGRIERSLYTNADREVRALWNLLSDAGRDSLVVGYHNTFPAEVVEGAVVSNYLVQARMATLMRSNTRLPERFASSLIHPPDLLDEVLALERETRGRMPAELGRFVDFTAAEFQAFIDQPRTLDDPASRRRYHLEQAWVFDTFHAETATRLYARLDPDLMLLHFQSVDIASHNFLYYDAPEFRDAGGLEPQVVEELEYDRAPFNRTVGAFYDYLDDWLGRLLELRDDSTAVMLLSDHGFESALEDDGGGRHDDAPPGILVLQGPGIVHGRIDDATLYDILPTLLTSMDLPLSEELEGRPLRSAFCDDAWEQFAHRKVPSYEGEQRFVPHIEPPDEIRDAIEERLRSLGYVQ